MEEEEGREPDPPAPAEEEQPAMTPSGAWISDGETPGARGLQGNQDDDGGLLEYRDNVTDNSSDFSDSEEVSEFSDYEELSEFSESIEVFFCRAEDQIEDNCFNLDAAKEFVMNLRECGNRFRERGCPEEALEDLVLGRAYLTVLKNTNERLSVGSYQTVVYLYCARAVFHRTIGLKISAGVKKDVMYTFSTDSLAHFHINSILDVVAAQAPERGSLQLARSLLSLAGWLEPVTPPVAHLIANRCHTILDHLIATSRLSASPPGATERLETLDLTAMVICASCFVRCGFISQTKANYYKHLMRVDVSRLPPALASRHAYVHASLLHNCGQLVKAQQTASDALAQVTNLAERREFQKLLEDIARETERRSSPDLHCQPDLSWLEGTSAVADQVQALQSRRHSIKAPTNGKKGKRKAVSKERRSASAARSPAPPTQRGRSGVKDVDRRPPSASVSCTRGGRPSQQHAPSSSSSSSSSSPAAAATFLPHSLPGRSDDESDEDGEEDVERDIHLVGVRPRKDSSERENSEEESALVSAIRGLGDAAEENNDWFDKSQEALDSGEGDEEELLHSVELSDRQNRCFSGGIMEGRRVFYPPIPRGAAAEHLLRIDPKRYKRCQLKIERAHKSIAKVLDAGSPYTEILIEGRSKAGQTFMDDEVVVEITAEPGKTRGGPPQHHTRGGPNPAGSSSPSSNDKSAEKMAHGKVVGFLKRVHFNDVEHPVLFCTLDPLEGHLMKPLCKTVPKIHVLNNLVKQKFPALTKNRIQLMKIDESGGVEHVRFLTVQPYEREQYVFQVALLAWRDQSIYPLGAVLGAHKAGRDYDGGLKVLCLQQKVPRLYPRQVVTETSTLLQRGSPSRAGRLDLTGQRVFTIDPPGSRDLDDAVSVQRQGPHWRVGVHIADVAAVLVKDSAVDVEARKRAVTFYPLDRRPRAMLPEPLSHGTCSLLEGQDRLALSVFFTFNGKGKQVEEPTISKSVVRSRRQLTYDEAQTVIDGGRLEEADEALEDDIRQLHEVTSLLQKRRQQESMLFVPFEDARLSDEDHLSHHLAAHSLIEELMILANSTVAGHLLKRSAYRHVLIARTHAAPSWQELAEWRQQEGHALTHLVMQLQGKTVSPSGDRLSINNISNNSNARAGQRPPVVLQKEVWRELCAHLESGEIEKARRLAFQDALHPLQCLAASRWMDLMESAQYRCCHELNSFELRHFGLDLDVYTHFTSPIRRYVDVHVQRLLHAALDNRPPDFVTPDDVTALCQHVNSATSRQKAFGRGCTSLKVSECLQRQPMEFRAFVDDVDSEQLTVLVPSLLKTAHRRQELPFSMLGVSSQPEVTCDTALQRDSVTVQWSLRGFDKLELCPGALRNAWRHVDNTGPQAGGAGRKFVVLYINPDQVSESVRLGDWADILQRLATPGDEEAWDRVPLAMEPRARPAEGPADRNFIAVDHMTCERGPDATGGQGGKVSQRPVRFKRVYTKGQVLTLQLSVAPKAGVLTPRVELLHTARNASVCTLHASEPVPVLADFATRVTRDQQFSSYVGYARAWMPLVEMEAAMEAGGSSSDGSVVIENVSVSMKTQQSHTDLLYRGSFSLSAKFCYDRCIDFGGKSSDTIGEEEFKSDNSYPLDYLCLRHKTPCLEGRVGHGGGGVGGGGKHYTWLAHASVVRVNHLNKKSENGGKLVVTFVLNASARDPPAKLMSKDGGLVTVEVIAKNPTDRRAQLNLLNLADSRCVLAQAVAFGRSIPELDPEHRKLGKKSENHEVNMDASSRRHLPRNNTRQLQAIQMALTHSLTLVQGPPGTGKTNTGIKLVYLFNKINSQLQAEGGGKKTVLYCGPSNKSVDLVARELRSKLGSKCPKIIRMYGSAIENKDYPVPRADGSSRSLRDLNSDPALKGVTLHHVIRMKDKPHADKIAVFDSHFEQFQRNPERYPVSNKDLKAYRKLVNKASKEELSHCDVVLATISVGGSPKLMEGTMKSIYQVIIDECAMSTEPHAMVPLVACRAQQVVLIGDHKQLRPIIQSSHAESLGLSQSLFERLFTKFPRNTVFLSTQYRMHPEICAFPSDEFYESSLETALSSLWNQPPLTFWPRHPLSPPNVPPHSPYDVIPHVLIDVRGKEETLTVSTEEGNENSKSNALEAEKVLEVLNFLMGQANMQPHNVKILTQYNAQRCLLDKQVPDPKMVSTVVSSQGGEWDYVILSTVRSLPSYMIEPNPTHGWCRQNLGFITDLNQVNVALTRARKGLIIIGNVELLRCDETWGRLVERYESLGCCVTDPTLFPPPPPPTQRKAARQQRALLRPASVPAGQWRQA